MYPKYYGLSLFVPQRQHRTFSLLGTRAGQTGSSKPRLVILGSGWGGYQILRKIDKKRWDVTVVSPTSYFAFTPLLAGCAVGTLEFRSTIEPVRRFARQTTSHQAWCDSIDFGRKTLLCVPTTPTPTSTSIGASEKLRSFELQYDKLVIAVGAYSQTFGIPGVKEHAHFLKNPKDARDIRMRIVECFEQASQPGLTEEERRALLHFCIVGGGPTGVEFAAELHDLLHSDAIKYYPEIAKMATITLFDVAPHILSSFDERLVKYAERKFVRDRITIKSNHHVEKVEKGVIHVKELGKVPYGLLVWSTGLAPNPLVEDIKGIRKDPRTAGLIVNQHMNLVKEEGSIEEDVWALGDVASITESPLPATAQVASQQGLYMAKKLNSLVSGRHTSSDAFQFQNMGTLAYLGDRKALFDRSKLQHGWKAKSAGALAWLLWRSAYMTMTLSWRNKLVVPFYWALNAIFGRDMSRF